MDKAYPELEEEAREYITLNIYLDQLQQPQTALVVRQERPRTLTEAVKATLELETFLPRHDECGEDNQDVAVSRQVSSQEADVPVKIDTLSSITTLLENLNTQLTQLEGKLRSWHPCQIDSHQRGRHTRDQTYKLTSSNTLLTKILRHPMIITKHQRICYLPHRYINVIVCQKMV